MLEFDYRKKEYKTNSAWYETCDSSPHAGNEILCPDELQFRSKVQFYMVWNFHLGYGCVALRVITDLISAEKWEEGYKEAKTSH